MRQGRPEQNCCVRCLLLTLFFASARPESVVGWYHSHPGFGCWLSSVDINTQQSFEQLTPRAVAVVVDPIQSVKGKVVIDAVPPDQPPVSHARPGAATKHLEPGPPEQAIDPGAHPRP